jgi:hypothetical protein
MRRSDSNTSVGSIITPEQELELEKNRNLDRMNNLRDVLQGLEAMPDDDKRIQAKNVIYESLDVSDIGSFNQGLTAISENPRGQDYPGIRAVIKENTGIEGAIAIISGALSLEIQASEFNPLTIYRGQKYSRGIKRLADEGKALLATTNRALEIIVEKFEEKNREFQAENPDNIFNPFEDFLNAAQDVLEVTKGLNFSDFPNCRLIDDQLKPKFEQAFSQYLILKNQHLADSRFLEIEQEIKEESGIDGILVQPLKDMPKFELLYRDADNITKDYLKNVSPENKTELEAKQAKWREFAGDIKSSMVKINGSLPKVITTETTIADSGLDSIMQRLAEMRTSLRKLNYRDSSIPGIKGNVLAEDVDKAKLKSGQLKYLPIEFYDSSSQSDIQMQAASTELKFSKNRYAVGNKNHKSLVSYASDGANYWMVVAHGGEIHKTAVDYDYLKQQDDKIKNQCQKSSVVKASPELSDKKAGVVQSNQEDNPNKNSPEYKKALSKFYDDKINLKDRDQLFGKAVKIEDNKIGIPKVLSGHSH